MRWTPGGESSDIEDRRGEGGGGGGFGFGGGGFGGAHIGIGGVILLLVLSVIFKQNLFTSLGGGPAAPATRPYTGHTGEADRDAGENRQVQFVSFVLDDVQKTWQAKLPNYRHAKLVLFRDTTQSGCGWAQSATGPFYCPEDEKVYIDLGFFDELARKFGAPGEFAEAYVIAHELGHHVQKVLGIEQKVSALQHRDPAERNPLSVRVELQADCFAGVWGHSTEQRDIIDQSDIAGGLRAAAAVGDDRLQRMATGHVAPDSFTHGSSADRVKWFRRGLETGEVSACDTFSQQ